MKLLIATPLFPPDIGGPATYSKLLLDELPKHGIEAEILNFGSIRHFPKGISHFAYFFKILIRGRKADVILVLDSVSVGLPVAIAAKMLGKKFIVKIVGDYAWEQGVQRFEVKELLDDFLGKKYGWRVEFLRKVQKFTAERADKIIVPSYYLKSVVARWGIDESKIQVIYNAFSAPDPHVSKENARRELGLGINSTIIVSAGRNVPWKGFQMLRDLIPEISMQIPDSKLFILSDVTKDKLLLYLRSADIFILNTGYEGFSHQLLEAMAMEIPIITTRVGGNMELIEDGVSGILVGYNNKEELKRAIVDLNRDSELKNKLAQNAKEKVKIFSTGKTIKETIDILYK